MSIFARVARREVKRVSFGKSSFAHFGRFVWVLLIFPRVVRGIVTIHPKTLSIITFQNITFSLGVFHFHPCGATQTSNMHLEIKYAPWDTHLEIHTWKYTHAHLFSQVCIENTPIHTRFSCVFNFHRFLRRFTQTPNTHPP